MNTYDELLNDPAKLANMTFEEIEALTASTEGQLKDGETVESPATPAAVDKVAVDDPKGILGKDGESLLPYSVLEGERNKTKGLVANLTARDARIAELEAQAAQNSVGDLDIEDDLLSSEEEIEGLKDELPELAAKNVRKDAFIRAQATALAQKNNELQRLQQTLSRDNTQLAIDTVPKLAFIQSSKPALFGLAVTIDKQLQIEAETDPAIAAMSLSQRFVLAIERLEAEIGMEINLTPSSKPSSEQLNQATTNAKLAADSKANVTPTSMADIPGGTIPPVDEFANFFEKSPMEMEVALSKMTTAQQNKLYARIT